MKLFVRQDKNVDGAYPQNVFLSYGKSLTPYRVSDINTLAEWEKVKDKNKVDGWYVKVTIPFTRNKLHINPNTFESEVGPMRYTLLFKYRVANRQRKPIKHLVRGWFPV
jgi:hypothetical protein